MCGRYNIFFKKINFSLNFFFAPVNMKKPLSNRPQFFFSIANWPKNFIEISHRTTFGVISWNIVHKYTLFRHLSILITYESLYFLKLRFYIKPVLGNETGKVFCIICPKAFFVLENKLKKEWTIALISLLNTIIASHDMLMSMGLWSLR